MSKALFVKGLTLSVALLSLASCHIFSQALNDDGNGPLAEALIKKNSDEELLREEIIEFASEYIGTKYRSAGKSPSGFDCSGFVYYVMKEFNVKMAASSATQEHQGKKISKKEAQPGDLVFFRRSKGGRVFHVAMVLENNDGEITLIHSTTNRGVVIDHLEESSYWKSKVMTFRNVLSNM